MSIATRIQAIEEHISDAYDSLSKFGVAAPSNKNIENIASLVNEIYDNTPKTDYASGTNLTLENTRIGKIDFKDTDTIEKIGLGATSQDSEPTPDNPQDINVVKGNNEIVVTGKNLLKFNYASRIANGITITKNSDNSYTLQGTATALTLISTDDRVKLKANTQYVLGISNGNSNVQISLRTEDGSTQYANTTTTKYVTYTPTENIVARPYIRIPKGANINETIYPIVAYGNTLPTYEPYIENNYEINLSSKNLIENETFVQGGTVNNTATTRISCRNIKLKANTTYTLSSSLNYNKFKINICTLETMFPHAAPFTYDSGWKSENFSFTVGANDVYANIAVRNEPDGTAIVPSDIDGYHFQIEKGNIATPYEPYKTPIELCKINTYQDYIYKNDKNWYLHKEIEKVILDGSEIYALDGALTNVNRFRLNITSYKINNITSTNSGLCNQLKIVNAYSQDDEHAYSYGNSSYMALYLFYNKTRCADVGGLQTWLNTNNLIIYGLLNTPTEIQITDENLIAQLDAWYNAQSMDDITYITVDGDLPMQLKLRALKK